MTGSPSAGARRPRNRHGRRLALAWALLAASGLAMLAQTGGAVAQDNFPSRPIRLIVPFPAGGVVDLVARAVTETAATDLGQPIVVEARPGANGNIGIAEFLRTPPDGYTILMGTPNLATNPLLMPAVTKWKTSDFVGVALVGAPPNVFVASPALPVKTMKEFVDLAKTQPGKLAVTNPGIGTSNHLGQELFFGLSGIELQNVMYKGQPQMIPDVVSGQVAFGLMTSALARPHILEGKLRALAVSSPRRLSDLPDVPTIAEAGYPDAMFLPWYGFVAQAATPKDVLTRLSEAMRRALASPEVNARLAKLGAVVTPLIGPEFDRLMASESRRWADLIRQRNIKLPD